MSVADELPYPFNDFLNRVSQPFSKKIVEGLAGGSVEVPGGRIWGGKYVEVLSAARNVGISIRACGIGGTTYIRAVTNYARE